MSNAYKRSGVDLAAGDEVVKRIGDAVRASYTPQVLKGLGAFGGLYSAAEITNLNDPVLVASTDSIGTKTKLAYLNNYATAGYDIVNHCVNDILVQGAKPLFFLDYFASAAIAPEVASRIVVSVAEACKALGIPLLGGETAELPGVYQDEEFDLVGTVVGVVERAKVVTGERIQNGDKVFALASGGLQTNGFSLARAVLGDALDEPFGEHTVGLELLTPHRDYLEPVHALLNSVDVRGMAHITGGGIPGNLVRVLPEGLGAKLEDSSWDVPKIFDLIETRGEISREEMNRVFNRGAGFLIVVAQEDAHKAAANCPETLFEIGEIDTSGAITLT